MQCAAQVQEVAQEVPHRLRTCGVLHGLGNTCKNTKVTVQIREGAKECLRSATGDGEDTWECCIGQEGCVNCTGLHKRYHVRWEECSKVHEWLVWLRAQRNWGRCMSGGDLPSNLPFFPAAFPIADAPCQFSKSNDFAYGSCQGTSAITSLHFLLASPLTCEKLQGNVQNDDQVTMTNHSSVAVLKQQPHNGTELATTSPNFISLGVMGPAIL